MQKMKSGHSRGWNYPTRVNIKTKPEGFKTEEDYIDHFLSMRDTARACNTLLHRADNIVLLNYRGPKTFCLSNFCILRHISKYCITVVI